MYVVKDNDSSTVSICNVNDEGEFQVILQKPFSEDWVDFSFTMNTDINVSMVTEATLGDETKEVEITLDPYYDWKPIDQFSFTTYVYDEGESISEAVAADSVQTGLHMARLIIRDPALPEPAVLAILGLIAALALRKRG